MRGYLIGSWLAGAIVASACDSSQQRPLGLQTPRVTTNEDTQVDIRPLEGAINADGHVLVVTDAQATGHTARVVGGEVIRVVPAANFNGSFTVTYHVKSDDALPTPASALVTVLPVNDPPVATGGDRTIHGATTVELAASDVDHDALDFTVTGAPAHGTITGTPPMLTYTPDPGYFGDDEISYQAVDRSESSVATLHLHVTAGVAPVAHADSRAVGEDQKLVLPLSGSDDDGDALTYAVVAPPQHGTLDGTPPLLTYTPDENFAGSDELEFSVTDPFALSSTAKVAIQVTAINDAPTVVALATTTPEDTGVTIALQGSDVEASPLTFQPGVAQHGTVTLSGSSVLYTPALNFHGTDEFSYTAFDGAATSAPAKVKITVDPVNDAPLATSFTIKPTEDTALAVALAGSDVDGDPISFAISAQPTNGALSGDPPNLTYTPNPNFNGADEFKYTVSDGPLTTTATVSISVTAVNDPPVSNNVSLDTSEDVAIDFTLPGSDVDVGDTLTFSVATPPDGTVTGTGASRKYTPAANVSGTRTFNFTVSDGKATVTRTITVAIAAVNDPPSPKDDFLATDPGTPLTFDVAANDADVDGDPVELDAVDEPEHGTAEVIDGKLVYTPAAGFQGIELVSYTVIDSNDAPATGIAHIGVGTFPPDAPAETLLAALNIVPSQNPGAPSISGDGRFIALVGFGLLPGDTFGVNIYLYDRGNRTLIRISAPGGGQPNGGSLRPRLSGNGRYVAFESVASNLVAGDTNTASDVFRYDRITGELIRVSVATGGGQANGSSIAPQISDDGNLVAFASTAFNLVTNDANGASDIFVRDVAAGTTERVSVSITGGDIDLAANEPALSGDGRFVAFSSPATNVVTGDTNNVGDVFVRDRVAGTTSRASVSSTGGEANAVCSGPAISQDGRFVSFLSNATNLVAGVTTAGQLYVRDAQAQTTTRPLSQSSVSWGRLSGDGRYLAQQGFNGVQLRDRFAAVTATPTGATSWLWPSLSLNGRYAVAITSGGTGSLVVAPNPL